MDIIDGEYCGNTILCATYTPYSAFCPKSKTKIKKLSQVAGSLAAFYTCNDYTPYQYNHSIRVTIKDFHFPNKMPIKEKSSDGFILFCMLCNINYSIIFIENLFTEEIVQKLRIAYLQYYYLCKFVEELNSRTQFKLTINNSLCNMQFRNCLAHYGLGQFMKESDIDENDLLKGLTKKAFNLNYMETKKEIYNYLTDLANQIKAIIF